MSSVAERPFGDAASRLWLPDSTTSPVDEELLLPGGSTSDVTRIGATVRRPTGYWTPAVHDLLLHLEASGFVESPRALGTDERGREVLSFIDGETTARGPWPSWVWAEDTLVQAGRLLRRYHQAVATFSRTRRRWLAGPASVSPNQVVCHNDFAPYNVVYRNGRLVGMIDWDWAGPAAPEWDLAMAAFAWVPLFDPAIAARLEPRPPTDIGARLRLLLDSYGLPDREGFVTLVADRVEASVEGIKALADRGWARYATLIDTGHVTAMAGAVAYLRHTAGMLEAAARRE
jgi:hypothetical protein